MENPVEISVHDLKQMLDGGEELLLLDVRNPGEVEVASIAGARHIPMGEIATRLGELDDWRERRIAVLCHGGVRSVRVQAFLMAQGFSQVLNVAGGIHAWSLEVDPTVPVY
jgi:rhodanese-related sulfurtransferase